MRRRLGFSAAALLLPALLWLVIAWAWPLLLVLTMSVRQFDAMTLTGKGLTLAHYVTVLHDAFYLEAFGRTLWIAALTTVLAGVLGYPAAYHVAMLRSERTRALLTLVLLVPVMLSLVVTAFAWILILGPSGLINRALLGLGLAATPVRFLNSELGVVIVLVYSFSPYMILSIHAALANIDPSLVRVARILGASPWQAFWRVTLPLSVPGIVSGALIVFSLSAAAFVTPFIIGGSRVKVVPLLVYNFAVATFDWPAAAVLSVILLALMLGITYGVARASERRFMAWMRGA